MDDFFDYNCDLCEKPFCERIHIMNLALGNVDEEFCLECLASAAGEGMPLEEFYNRILGYVEARECFKTPWDNFNANLCPRIERCFCKIYKRN